MKKKKSTTSPLKKTETLFRRFPSMRILIVGDVMLDSYVWGKVERISPEAPVPVVTIQKKENRPGGAANVALNILSMGATPILCSVVGDDEAGRNLLWIMRSRGISPREIITSRERSTTVKTRIIGSNHQMLRVDEETDKPLSQEDEKKLREEIKSIIRKEKPDAVIFEDYDKGVITEHLISEIISAARKLKIPVAVDPKKKNFRHYRNVSLFKPNMGELRDGIRMDKDFTDPMLLVPYLEKLRQEQEIETIMVTLSEKGVLAGGKAGYRLIPAHIRNIADVSGAGDTVIAVAALCLAAGLDPVSMATLSNLAGGLVCEKAGVVPVDSKQLAAEASRIDLH